MLSTAPQKTQSAQELDVLLHLINERHTMDGLSRLDLNVPSQAHLSKKQIAAIRAISPKPSSL